MCAVSSEGPVGADIERIGNVAAADVALYLGTAERDWAGDDPRRLLELWTRKEAIVKAAGERGLRQMPLFEVLQNGTLLNGQRWYTAPIDAGGDYIAHVAGAEVPPRPRIEKITPEMLL
jgi:4'-phosphopantetheinyl transferase